MPQGGEGNPIDLEEDAAAPLAPAPLPAPAPLAALHAPALLAQLARLLHGIRHPYNSKLFITLSTSLIHATAKLRVLVKWLLNKLLI
jgi:hypothetical protein